MTDPDVVIVGGGSAGCVLAARLSEDPTQRVLLLEAGPDYPRPQDVPPEIADGSGPTASHDWGFASEPLGPDRRTIRLLRGRLMGGCSSTNACFALRGSPHDYDDWAAAGVEGWSFDEVLPFFRMCETDLDFGTEPWHGDAGPLPIRRDPPSELAPSHAAALEAAKVLGHPTVADHNAPGAVGAGLAPVNRVGGARMSTASTYLAAARGRPNLTIRPDSQVDRVAVAHGRATGVRLVSGEVVGGGAVILAAGAYGSPAILLRSGVGPAADLRVLGVEVAVDLPGVGRNLIEHAWASVDVPARANPPAFPLAQTVITCRSSFADPAGAPDLHVVPTASMPTDEVSTGAILFIGVSVMKPRSRGRVAIGSADPTAPPRIDTGLLTHPDDVARMVEGVRTARALLRTAPLADLVAGTETKPAPGVSDDDGTGLAAGIAATFDSYFHPVGTCAMGADPDRGAVVDARGAVHGVAGLMVADASVMPDIPSANTNLPTIMVAERIASWLR